MSVERNRVATRMFRKVPSTMRIKFQSNLGMLLLGIWLILTGLIPLLGLTFSGLGMLMAILALAAGVLIVIGR